MERQKQPSLRANNFFILNHSDFIFSKIFDLDKSDCIRNALSHMHGRDAIIVNIEERRQRIVQTLLFSSIL